jgi:hypothetical protein
MWWCLRIASAFHNLPLQNLRRLVFPEINLVLQSIGRIEDCFHNGVYDFPAVHGDADVVADFVGFGRHGVSLAKRGRMGGHPSPLGEASFANHHFGFCGPGRL